MTENLTNQNVEPMINSENENVEIERVRTIKIASSANIFESNFAEEKNIFLKEEKIKKPNFYYTQGMLIKAEFIFKLVVSTILILGSIAAILFIYLQHYSYSIFAIPTFFGTIGLAYGSWAIINHTSYKNDLKSIDIENESRAVIPSLTNIYRKISTRNVNTNWFCAGIYFFGIIAIFITLISVWGINYYENGYSNFGSLKIINNSIPEIFVYTLASIMIVSFVYHVSILLLRQWRINKFDTFYGFQLVSQPEIDDIKKAKSKRNKWIFVFLVIIMLFIFWIIYHFVFKKRINAGAKANQGTILRK